MVDRVVGNNRKKKVKRLSNSTNYYPTAFISRPCDQLFGPQPLDCSISSIASLDSNNAKENSFSGGVSSETSLVSNDYICNKSLTHDNSAEQMRYDKENSKLDSMEKFDYIPAPKWNKIQNSLLEELFKKSRYPKPHELKAFAQRFNVMDSDIEVRVFI